MGRVIDARVRLPLELRPETAAAPTHLYSQYDAVLNLDASINKTLYDLEAEMEAAGVDHAIVHAEYEYGDPADALNESVARLVSRNPGRFSGFGTISQQSVRPMQAVQQLRQIAEMGLVGVNIQPAFFNMTIDHRSLYPVYAKAAELGLAVAVHTGVNYSRLHPMRNDHPLLLDQVACDFPELTLITCHSGWPWAAEMVAVARRHPNVLLDFGGMAPKYLGASGSGWEVMFRFMNGLLADQILFATDWPVMALPRVVAEWKELGLKPAVLAAALGGNADRLLTACKASRTAAPEAVQPR